MYKKTNVAMDHFRDHAVVYVFMTILFLIGIIFGAIIVNSMNFVQKQDLFFYLERFFGQILDGTAINNQELLKQSFFYQLKYLLLFFILGLSIIGLPIVWILVFIKGLVVGFSVGFFVNQMGWQGLLVAAASIAPQNLIIIPVYILAGSMAMIFSLTLLGKLFSRRMNQPLLQPFLQYSLVFIMLIVSVGVGAVLESLVSNQAMQVVIKWLYN
ncbi:stage II sporulation protein M [Aquibacillus sp. 3ASR75-11]|uniref:Stage II sporulation protein M n=1 Tax=Terrihalobacillus insolitus TaxID=2950438 RepID=A0A9X4AM32_9BACI|nr:stage II sporulation protein M [Terrihalobacillus insolitus]MDC3413114.1 stage II sporulation protein M [Terrihalobacillus insolitus]MDC3424856.1 stage II sporulation protein M [Terrihalobacillus insolitus]